jgi:hypothetical protein
MLKKPLILMRNDVKRGSAKEMLSSPEKTSTQPRGNGGLPALSDSAT